MKVYVVILWDGATPEMNPYKKVFTSKVKAELLAHEMIGKTELIELTSPDGKRTGHYPVTYSDNWVVEIEVEE